MGPFSCAIGLAVELSVSSGLLICSLVLLSLTTMRKVVKIAAVGPVPVIVLLLLGSLTRILAFFPLIFAIGLGVVTLRETRCLSIFKHLIVPFSSLSIFQYPVSLKNQLVDRVGILVGSDVWVVDFCEVDISFFHL